MNKEFDDLIQTFDNQGMLKLMLDFPNQVEIALEIAREKSFAKPDIPIQNLLMLGMGGSAIGGDILKNLLYASGTLPVEVIRDYNAPSWVDERSFALVSSYSGNTEETLYAYKDVVSRGCKCLVTTSGGKLLTMAKNKNHPVIQIPGGQPPRSALGYLLFPFLKNLVDWRWINSSLVDFGELLDRLHSVRENNDPGITFQSQAMKIAEFCRNRVPIIYSSTKMQTVAMRWKGQICENSKSLAYNNVIPEMNHNEIIGWQKAKQMGLHDKMAVIFIRDKEDHPRVIKRLDIVKSLIEESDVPIFELESIGNSLLTRIITLVYLADFVSFNLAMLNNENPTTIKNIDYLKSELSKYPLEL